MDGSKAMAIVEIVEKSAILGFLVNSETGHSEDRQPNLRHALGSVKRVNFPFCVGVNVHGTKDAKLVALLPACAKIGIDIPRT